MASKQWINRLVLAVVAATLVSPGAMAQKADSASSQSPAAKAQAGAQGADPLEMYKKTGINPEQSGKIDTLASGFQKLLADKTQVMVALMRDMHALSLQASPDEKTTLAKQDEINKLNNEMASERIKLMLKIRQVLTVDQRQKLVQLMQGRTAASANGATK